MTDEVKRINGYYHHNDFYYPSVTTILSSVGNPEALIQWAVKQGAYALTTEFLKDPTLLSHTLVKKSRTVKGVEKEILSSTSLMAKAEEIAIAGYTGEKNRTADWGTVVHNAVELWLRNEDYHFQSYETAQKTAFEAFIKFFDTIKPTTQLVEHPVYNLEMKYAGRLDWGARIDNIDALKPFLKRSVKRVPKVGNYIIDLKTGSFQKDKHGMQTAAYVHATEQTEEMNFVGGMVVHIHRDRPDHVSVHTYDREEIEEYYLDYKACARAWWRCCAPKWAMKQTKGETK